MQMETQAPLNVFVAPELWNADRDGDWGNISHRPRVCCLVLCSTTWYHCVCLLSFFLCLSVKYIYFFKFKVASFNGDAEKE